MAAEVFISYSSRDRERVIPIVKQLESYGVSVWFDQQGIEGSDLWRSEIVKGIEGCKMLILAASKTAVASENVVKEVSLASEGKKRLLPVFLEPVDIPEALRYQLAGVHHILLYTGDEQQNINRIVRSLHRGGVRVEGVEEILNAPLIELPDQQEDQEKIEEFQRKHRTSLVTLFFTEIVGFTEIRSKLGYKGGFEVIQEHNQLVRDILKGFDDAEEISAVGDSFFLILDKPSDAVRFALLFQNKLRSGLGVEKHQLQVRIGIHLGEVLFEKEAGRTKDLFGTPVDTCARVMSLATGDQILLTRSAFDSARQLLKGQDLAGIEKLAWFNHGSYALKGVDEPVEICEVGEFGRAVLRAPNDGEKAKRLAIEDAEQVVGWRPAVGQLVPNTHWELMENLGEGGFGEVWVGEHQKLKEKRVFKFCFKSERVRSLKREVTLFRLLKENIGEHPNIARIYEVYFDEAPYYIVMDYVEGSDLKTWCEQQGGIGKVSINDRLEIVAQTADALQAAHDSGVAHRDVKPGNILVNRQNGKVQVKLTDFGIGQVLSEEFLAGKTGAGFTMTLVGSTGSQSGTQMYMAPELLAGNKATPQSDIFSLGVVLYQLLIEDFSKPVTIDWARRIENVLMREDLVQCFAGEPEDRFASSVQLAKGIRSLDERGEELAKQQADIQTKEKAAYRRGVIRTTALASIIIAIISTLAVYLFYYSKKAEQARLAESELRDVAVENELHARRLLYESDMDASVQAWKYGDVEEVRRLLDRHRPGRPEKDLRGFEWYYLRQHVQEASLVRTLEHTNSVNGVAISPSGRIIATAAGDEIFLWDAVDGGELGVLRGHNADVSAIVFSHDEKTLASATHGEEGEILLWNVAEMKTVAKLSEDIPAIGSLAFTPEGAQLAAGGRGHVILLWDLKPNEWKIHSIPKEYARYGGLNFDISYSPDGGTLAACFYGGIVVLWDIEEQRVNASFQAHAGHALSAVFSPDGKILATGGHDSMLRLWDVEGQKRVFSLGHSFQPEIVANHVLATLEHAASVHSVVFFSDGMTVVTGSGDSTVRLWDLDSRKETRILKGHSAMVQSVAVSNDGRTLVSGSNDETARVWDVTERRDRDTLVGHNYFVLDLAFSPDGKTLISTSIHDPELLLWDLSSRQTIDTGAFDSAAIDRLNFSPLTNTLAVGRRGVVEIWDFGAMELVVVLPEHSGRFSAIEFSPDGLTLAVGTESGRITLWNIKEKQKVIFTEDYQGWHDTVAFSADGKLLAAPLSDHSVPVWNVVTKKEVVRIPGHAKRVNSLNFSPDGTILATGSEDTTVRLWDVATGGELKTLEKHSGEVWTVVFSPDGKSLATGATDGTIRIWNVARMEHVATFRGHSGTVSVLSFSPDGRTLASGSFDTTVKLWRTGADLQ